MTVTRRPVSAVTATPPEVIGCSICGDCTTLSGPPEHREAEASAFAARHEDEPHEPPSVAAGRRKR